MNYTVTVDMPKEDFYKAVKSGVEQAMKECELKIGMTLKEAVERQIPKKITHEATLQRCATCPTCKNVLDEFIDFTGKRVRVTVQHCKFCGQALDWSDTDD